MVLEEGNGETGFATGSASVVPASLLGDGNVRVTLPNWRGNGWSAMRGVDVTGAMGVIESVGVMGRTGVDCVCILVGCVLVLFVLCSSLEMDAMEDEDTKVVMLPAVGVCVVGVT